MNKIRCEAELATIDEWWTERAEVAVVYENGRYKSYLIAAEDFRDELSGEEFFDWFDAVWLSRDRRAPVGWRLPSMLEATKIFKSFNGYATSCIVRDKLRLLPSPRLSPAEMLEYHKNRAAFFMKKELSEQGEYKYWTSDLVGLNTAKYLSFSEDLEEPIFSLAEKWSGGRVRLIKEI